MPIEFPCSHCQRLLRTPDGSEGQQARCPACERISLVPSSRPEAPASPAQGGSFAPPPPPPYSSAPDDLYSGAASGDAATYRLCPGVFQPTKIFFGDVFRETWKIFISHLGVMVVVGLVMLAMQVPLLLFRADPLASLVLVGLYCLVHGTILLALLRMVRGESLEVDTLWMGWNRLLKYGAVHIVYSLAILGGTLLLVIPGIIAAIMFSQAFLVVLDRPVGIGEAFSISQGLTKGNRWTLFAICLAWGPVLVAVNWLTEGLGGSVLYPFSVLMSVTSYLMISGEYQREMRAE